MKNRKWIKIVGVILLILCLLVVTGVFFAKGMVNRGASNLQENAVSQGEMISEEPATQEEVEEGVIYYGGEKYRYNEEIYTVLFMGIDSYKGLGAEHTEEYGDQSDTNILFVINLKEKSIQLISISRDTMTDVEVYTADGEYFNTVKSQLALQYAYGDGKEKSCELMVKAVSNLMYGLPIHGYCAMSLHGIAVANDAVGGVKIVALEDIDEGGFRMKKGTEKLLKGKEARYYVMDRNKEVFASNSLRMQRQKQYLNAFADQLKEKMQKDITVPVKLYQALDDYMITDISLDEMSYLATLALECEFDTENILTVAGKVEKKEGEKYEEYYVDEEALYQLILDVFYEKIEKTDINVSAH